MDSLDLWQCAECNTLVEWAITGRCPNCGHVFFYPLPEHVSDSETNGSGSVENVNIEEALARLEEGHTGDEHS